MRHQSVRRRVQQVVVPLESLCDVVRRKDRDLRRKRQPLRTHQLDVRPRDRQDARAPPRSRRDRSTALGVPKRHHRVIGKERCQVRRHADRSHPRPATAVRNAERLVQVEVTDIGADITRSTKPHLRIHVGTVHVYLPAVLMHHVADLADRCLEHTVRRRIRDHQRRQLVGMLLGLLLQIGNIDVPLRIRRHYYHRHPRHHRARRVRPMRTHRDQAHRAMLIATGPVICADRQQPRELTLRPGVGLQRDLRKPGDLAQ